MRAVSGFDDLERHNCVPGIDRWGTARVQRRNEQAIELGVVSTFGPYRLALPGRPKAAPTVRLLISPIGCRWIGAIAQPFFLYIHAELDVGALVAEDAKAWAGLGFKRAHPQMRSHARRVCQRDKRVIVHVDARAATIELGVHVCNGPEEHERLVDEMCASVEEQAAGVLWRREHPPAGLRNGPPASETRFEPKHAPLAASRS